MQKHLERGTRKKRKMLGRGFRKDWMKEYRWLEYNGPFDLIFPTPPPHEWGGGVPKIQTHP